MRRMMLVLAGGSALAIVAGAAVTLSTELVSAHSNVRVEHVSINRVAKSDRATTISMRTNGLRNETIVLRSTAPAASRQTEAAPAPALQPSKAAQQDHKLLDGCEQSISPLASTSSVRARCVS